MSRSALLPLPSFLRASAMDAANQQMRQAGRCTWSRADRNEAVRKLDALVSSCYGEGARGQFRYQIASELEQDGRLSCRMTMKQLNAVIDAALIETREVAEVAHA
jgi:hypothetical protein